MKFYQNKESLDHTAPTRASTGSLEVSLFQRAACLCKAVYAAWMHTRGRGNSTLEGFSIVLQSIRNKLMHSMHGNSPRSVILLECLLPPPVDSYDKDLLLKYRPTITVPEPTSDNLWKIKIIPHSHPIQAPRFKQSRSGRRVRYLDSKGTYVNFTPKRKRPLRGPPNSRMSKNSLFAGRFSRQLCLREARREPF